MNISKTQLDSLIALVNAGELVGTMRSNVVINMLRVAQENGRETTGWPGDSEAFDFETNKRDFSRVSDDSVKWLINTLIEVAAS